MMTEGGKYITKFALFSCRVTDAIGRKQWKPKRAGNLKSSPVAELFITMKMSLQFDIYIFMAEDLREPLKTAAAFGAAAAR